MIECKKETKLVARRDKKKTETPRTLLLRAQSGPKIFLIFKICQDAHEDMMLHKYNALEELQLLCSLNSDKFRKIFNYVCRAASVARCSK